MSETTNPTLPPYMTKLHQPGQRDAGTPTIVLPFPLLSDAELAQPYRPAGATRPAGGAAERKPPVA